MWSRNTIRGSSHISFFCGGDPLCVFAQRLENTHGVADRFAWVTSGSPSQSRTTDLILSFNSHVEIWTHLFAHLFSVYGWLSELPYFWFFFGVFFPIICSSYLRTEISVTLSTGNKLHSSLSSFIFPVKPLCWCYLATTLNLLSSSMLLCHQLRQYII